MAILEKCLIEIKAKRRKESAGYLPFLRFTLNLKYLLTAVQTPTTKTINVTITAAKQITKTRPVSPRR